MITIKDSKGNIKMQVVENASHQRKYELMVTDEVSLKFTSKEDIVLSIGDYIDVADGRFFIVSEHQATRNDTNGMYDYSPVFYDELFLLKNKILKYSHNGGAEASFSLTDTIYSHVTVLKENLQSLGYDYTIEVDDSISNSVEITYSSVSVFDALGSIASAFECEWWKEDNVIHFGQCNKSDVTEWGYSGEISTLKPQRSKSGFASRIYAFGSSENLPGSYRKSLNLRVSAIDGHRVKLTKAVTAEMFGGTKVYQDEQTVEFTKVTEAEIKNKYESPVTNISLKSGSYKVNLSKVDIYVMFQKKNASGVYVGRDTNAIVNVTFFAKTASGKEQITNIQLTCVNENYVSILNDYEGNRYFTTNKDIVGFYYTIEIVSDTTASDGRVVFTSPIGATRNYIKVQNQYYKLITDTNIGQVELNPDYDNYDKTAGWITVLGEVPTHNQIIKFDRELSYNIPLGWYEDNNTSSVKTGIIQQNLCLPERTEPVVDGSFKITQNYVQVNAVSDADVVEKVVVFEHIKPNFVITEYEVESEERTQKYSNSDETYKYTQYKINAPIMDGFTNKCILTTLGISFQGGKLNGMSFEAAWSEDRIFILPNTNYGRELPDNDIYPDDDDAFTLTGVDLSFFSGTSILNAEQDLLDATIDYLKTLYTDGLSYEVRVRPAYAQKNRKHVGSQIILPMGVQSRIYGYSYPLAKPYSNFVYQIGNSSTYSTIGSLQESVAKALNQSSGKKTQGAGLYVEGDDYLSKRRDDTAYGHISIENDLDVSGNTKVGGSISSEGGVSARGISDLSISGSGGGSNITVLRDDELEDVEYEDITHTASAYTTKRIKDIINVDEIEGFLPDKEYEAGILVKYNNKIYQFTDHHTGNWDSGIVKRFKLNEIANPNAISNTELDYMFNL